MKGPTYGFILIGLATITLCQWGQRTFYSAQNRALLTDRSIAIKTASSYVACARDCFMASSCVSVNFQPRGGRCELKDTTRADGSLGERPGSTYMDGDGATPLFSVPRSCVHLLEWGFASSGVYTIYPRGFANSMSVYCDNGANGGGWIVIQRRLDGSTNFNRDWRTYREGFGDLDGEFWLGNDSLLKLTLFGGWWHLRIDVQDWDGTVKWVEYGEFGVEGDTYRLHIDQFNNQSTLDNSLNFHNNYPFSANDVDLDTNPTQSCGKIYQGGWWFGYCTIAALNGPYTGSNVPYRRGIHWSSWKGNYYSLKSSTMKIRQLV